MKQLPELTHELISNVTRYYVNAQISVVNEEQTNGKLREDPIYITPENRGRWGTDLTQDMQDLYSESYKCCWVEGCIMLVVGRLNIV